LQWDLLKWDTHAGIQNLVADLNHLLACEPALYQGDFHGSGFEWVDCQNASANVLGYLRKTVNNPSNPSEAKGPAEHLLVCCNFTPAVREYRMGVPSSGKYKEIFNSDATRYGGSGVGNQAALQGDATFPYHGQPASVLITLPPLATIILKPCE